MSTSEPTASKLDSPKHDRLASLDQFRGYTVAGMFLVNYAGSFAAIGTFLPTLKHWHTHCSFADTIMPQFLFAVGFSFRMSYLKRLEKDGAALANWRMVRRILGLLLVALIVHHLDGKFDSWAQVKELGIGGFLQTAFQRNYFQTLAHIGITSLWVVPVIGLGVWPRLIYMIGSCLLFIGLSTSWYYDWELTRPGIDGGPLGFLTWTAPLILGTFAFDIWKSQLKYKAWTMSAIGACVFLIAYGLSCVNTFTFPNQVPEAARWTDYLAENPMARPLVPDSEEVSRKAGESENVEADKPLSRFQALVASGDAIPQPSGQQLEHWINRRNKVYDQLKAKGEIPEGVTRQQFEKEKWHQPGERYLNQWTMSQRAGSPAYTLFGGGLGMIIMALMLVVCDGWGLQLGVFRTLGVNALLGYILHGMVNEAVKPFVPKDAPLWFVLAGFAVSFGICYLVLRTLEKQKIIFRL